MIQLKRAYERASSADGTRVLVDRLWPRGFSKARLQIDAWLKDVGPSTSLRRWFNHDPAKWDEFRKRYARGVEADRREASAAWIVSMSGHEIPQRTLTDRA